MDDHEPPGPTTEARLDAKRAFFGGLDAKLAAAGYAVPAPPVLAPPAPAPPRTASFEAWAELAVRFAAASPEEMAAALAARGLTPDAWTRLDTTHRRALSDDLRAGRHELSALYQAKHKEALARRTGEPAPPAASVAATPLVMPTVQRAAEAVSGTFGLPTGLPVTMLESVGRMPFVPPPPPAAAPAQGKSPAKTVPSRAVPSRAGGQTLSLDAIQQRPTPTLPFAGSAGSQGVGYVPHLHARQYVALSAELALQPAPRKQTLTRYQVPTEAALRALEEQAQDPARRAELERALTEFAAELRRRVLG